MNQVISLTCLCLIRHYILNFGGSADDGQSYWDRELLGKTSVGGMVLVTLPALVGVLFGREEFSLTVCVEPKKWSIGCEIFLPGSCLAKPHKRYQP